MGLTGEKLKGIELVKCGVATHYVKQENFDKLKETIIQNLNEEMSSSDILNLIKQVADQTYDVEQFEFPNYNEIQNTFSIDNLEEIFKKLEIMSTDGSEEEQKWANYEGGKQTLRDFLKTIFSSQEQKTPKLSPIKVDAKDKDRMLSQCF